MYKCSVQLQQKDCENKKFNRIMATRRLTLFGKITFIKSLPVSQLMYILTPLPTYAVVLQKVNKLLFEFLWDGKGDTIKIEFITKDHEEGGLRMIDINIRSISPLMLPAWRDTLIRQIMENGNFLWQLKNAWWEINFLLQSTQRWHSTVKNK